jgi:hypothetical protein
MTSLNHFDSRSVTWRLGERCVAGDDRRIERLSQRDVHRVVRRDVLAQLPRASQKIEMGVTVEIELGEIRDGLGRTVSRHLACPYEPSETLRHFNVHQMGRMELVIVLKKAHLNPTANRRLQEELEQGRRIDDDHADSRSSRMTTAAGVFKVTRFRRWILASISSRVGRAARRASSASR